MMFKSQNGDKDNFNPFMIDFEKRVAVVTGGSNGVGLTIVKAFLQSGAFVANWDVHESKQLLNLQQEYPKRLITIKTDVGNELQIENAVKETTNKYKNVDILINNAGIMNKDLVEDLDIEAWDRLYNVNVKGTVLTTKHLLPYLKKSHQGRIINMSSMTSAIGLETYSPYSSSKAAVSNLTKVWALELAPYEITVNALCPGWIDTPMTKELIHRIAHLHGISKEQAEKEILSYIPQHRFISTEEIAFTILFLSSPLAQSISGLDLFIDMGLAHSFKPGFHHISEMS